MHRLRPHVKLTLRIYAERDEDLYRWLQGLDDLPYGHKAQEVKRVLRRGLTQAGASGGSDAPVDAEAIQRALTAALSDALADIRHIVEAAVVTALNEVQVTAVTQPGREEDPEEDVQDVLEVSDDNLVA